MQQYEIPLHYFETFVSFGKCARREMMCMGRYWRREMSRVGIESRCDRGNGGSEKGRVEPEERWGMDDRIEVHEEWA